MKNKIKYNDYNLIIENIIYILCLILPVSLITGSFLSEFSVSAISLCFLILSFNLSLSS